MPKDSHQHDHRDKVSEQAFGNWLLCFGFPVLPTFVVLCFLALPHAHSYDLALNPLLFRLRGKLSGLNT